MTLYRRGLEAMAGRLMASGQYADPTGVRYACAVFLIGPLYAAIGGGIVYAVTQNGQFTMLVVTALWGATYVAANLLLSVLRSQSRRGMRAPVSREDMAGMATPALVALADAVCRETQILNAEIQRRGGFNMYEGSRDLSQCIPNVWRNRHGERL